jgi:hypothetical protein
LWADASRSDLLLLRKAIRQRWPVLEERRGPIMEAVLSRFRAGAPDRKLIAAAWVMLDADRLSTSDLRQG